MWDFDPEKPVEYYEELSDEELKFDKFRLDEEYEEQPRLYDKWSKWWGRALLLRKKAEDEFERIKGTMDLEIRKDPRAHDLTPDDKGKVMESAIKAAVLINKKVLDAQDRFYKAYALAKALESSVKSFEQRKELLRGAGDLWVNKYYSDINIKEKAGTEETKEEIEKDLQQHRRRSL